MAAKHRITAVLFFLLTVSAIAQSNRPPLAPTIANFGLRAADVAQSCYHMTTPGWHEHLLPVNSCAGEVAVGAGFAFGSWALDYELRKHGHPRLAQFQWVSAAGSAHGIFYTFGR